MDGNQFEMTLAKSTFNKLKNIVGKSNCSMAKEDLACYAYDANVKGLKPLFFLEQRMKLHKF